jgi:hypothetical protein
MLHRGFLPHSAVWAGPRARDSGRPQGRAQTRETPFHHGSFDETDPSTQGEWSPPVTGRSARRSGNRPSSFQDRPHYFPYVDTSTTHRSPHAGHNGHYGGPSSERVGSRPPTSESRNATRPRRRWNRPPRPSSAPADVRLQAASFWPTEDRLFDAMLREMYIWNLEHPDLSLDGSTTFPLDSTNRMMLVGRLHAILQAYKEDRLPNRVPCHVPPFA